MIEVSPFVAMAVSHNINSADTFNRTSRLVGTTSCRGVRRNGCDRRVETPIGLAVRWLPCRFHRNANRVTARASSAIVLFICLIVASCDAAGEKSSAKVPAVAEPTATLTAGPSATPWTTATVPPTPTPTPVPESPEVGDPVFAFDLTQWWTGEVDGGEFYVQDGAYHIRVDDTSTWNIRSGAEVGEFADGSVSVDVKFVDSPSSSQAGCLRMRLEPSAAEYGYDFCINIDGHTMFGFGSSDDYETLSEWELRPGVKALGQWNTLEVRMAGDQFWLFANGQLVDVVSHDGLGKGLVGVSVINGKPEEEKAAEWAFRDLIVRELLR
jgi:hypothetical protein